MLISSVVLRSLLKQNTISIDQIFLKVTYILGDFVVKIRARIFTLPLGGKEYCDFVSVYPSVRYMWMKNGMSDIHEIFCTCYPWLWLGPCLTIMQYVMYFRFCGWFMGSLNGANTDVRIIQRDSPGGAATGEVRSVLLSIASFWIRKNSHAL